MSALYRRQTAKGAAEVEAHRRERGFAATEEGRQKAAHSLQSSDNNGKRKAALADKAYWTGLGVDPYQRNPRPLCRYCRKRGCAWARERYRSRCWKCR
eukprot:COSAG01_NODE_29709_length_631_cov_2.208647_1_plen_98_part_00